MPPPTRATRADRSSPPKARWSASSPGFSTRPNSASSSASGSPFPSSRPRARSACRRSEERKSMSREVTTLMERVLYEVKKMVVGQDHFLERVMVAMLAQGHLLVEGRSEEHTSELQSHSFISYAVFCLKKKKYIGL